MIIFPKEEPWKRHPDREVPWKSWGRKVTMTTLSCEGGLGIKRELSRRREGNGSLKGLGGWGMWSPSQGSGGGRKLAREAEARHPRTHAFSP